MDPTADFVGLTYALREIGSFAEDGWVALYPHIETLMTALVKLTLVLTICVWIFRPTPDSVAEFLWLVVKLQFVLWLMVGFWGHLETLFDMMVRAGIATAPQLEGMVSADKIRDPASVVKLSNIAVTPLMKHIDTMLGPIDTFWYMTELIFAYSALGCALLVYMILALLIFVASVEFWTMAIPAGFMIPFIIWQKTAFIASPALGYIVNSGIRLFGTSMAVVMGLAIMLAYDWPPEPAIQDSINILVLTIAILIFALKVYAKLSGLVNGGPVMGVDSVLSTLWTASRIGSAAGREVSEVAGGLRSGNGVVPRAVSGFVGGVRGAPGSSGTPSTGGPGGGGTGGGGGAAAGGFRGAFQRGMSGARANLSTPINTNRSVGGGQSSANSSWFQGPTQNQSAVAERAGVNLDGMNRAQASAALERAGVGRSPAAETPSGREAMGRAERVVSAGRNAVGPNRSESET